MEQGSKGIRAAGYPHPGCFLAKSAEAIEKKRVEFLWSAKKCKRVRKNVKRKNLSIVASDEWPFPAGSESSVGSAQGKRVAPGVGLGWTVSGMGRTSPLPPDFLELRILKGLREKAA